MVPALIALIAPVLGLTVAEPLPAMIAKVIAPPRPAAAVVVAVAASAPSTFNVLADVIVNIGVPPRNEIFPIGE